MRLKDEQVDLFEIQKNQCEDAKVNNQLMNKFKKQLSTNKIASSKHPASLKGRATILSTLLTNKKEKWGSSRSVLERIYLHYRMI